MNNEKKPSLAKNTAVLYFRMLFQMVVYLYTSRVIVSTLGLEDWGIYDVVGGIVLVIIFLNNSMTVCSQRYLTYALGDGDRLYLERTYSASLSIHAVLAILVLIVGETVGLWYVYNYVVIPPERFSAALVVYHCSLVSAACMVFTVPYNALVIAYEKMTAFAFISIVDVLLKLIIVLLLVYTPLDRLKFYALMLLLEVIVVRLVYIYYCKYNFRLRFFPPKIGEKVREETEKNSDKLLCVNMLKFSGWSVFGNFSVVCNTQGLNLLLNLLGGPILNAARVIAFNVQTAITAFVSSFQTAMNPRITKNYASGNWEYMNELVYISSRISYMLIFVIALPLLVETPFILRVWLHDIPEYAVVFTRLLIIVSMLDAISNPLTIAASATGQIKKYHLMVGGVLLLVLPVACVITLFVRVPEVVFIIQIFFVIVAQIVRILLCRSLFGLNALRYTREVLYSVFWVTIAGVILPLVAYRLLGTSVWNNLLVCVVAFLSAASSSFFLGLRQSERTMILQKLHIKKRTVL